MTNNVLFDLKRRCFQFNGNLPLFLCLASTVLFAIDCHQHRQQQSNDSDHNKTIANNTSIVGSSSDLSTANVTSSLPHQLSSKQNDVSRVVSYNQRGQSSSAPFNSPHLNAEFKPNHHNSQPYYSNPHPHHHSYRSHYDYPHHRHPHEHQPHLHSNYHHHHNHNHHDDPHYNARSIYYQPQIHLVDADRLTSASRALISDFAVGVGRAFHSMLRSQPSSRSGTGLLNDERVRSTASRLLPAASKLVERHVDPKLTGQNQTAINGNDTSPINYEVEGKKLREDIVYKLGSLQTILATTLEVSKERRDMFTRTLLDQTNHRLEQAKERAQKILSEPSNSERAVRTLYVLNQGINSISSFMHTLIGSKEQTRDSQNDPEQNKTQSSPEEQTTTTTQLTKA